MAFTDLTDESTIGGITRRGVLTTAELQLSMSFSNLAVPAIGLFVIGACYRHPVIARYLAESNQRAPES